MSETNSISARSAKTTIELMVSDITLATIKWIGLIIGILSSGILILIACAITRDWYKQSIYGTRPVAANTEGFAPIAVILLNNVNPSNNTTICDKGHAIEITNEK